MIVGGRVDAVSQADHQMVSHPRGLLRRGTTGAADPRAPPAPPPPAAPAPPRVAPVPPRGGGTTTVWERQVVPGRYQIHKKLGGNKGNLEGSFLLGEFFEKWNLEGFWRDNFLD